MKAALPTDVLIHPGAALLGIRDEYKDLDDSVRCAFPSCRTAHKHGFIVEFEQDGVRGLAIIGHICGKKYFKNWEAQQTHFRREANIAHIREQTERHLPAGNEVYAELEPIIGRLQWQMHLQQYLQFFAEDEMRAIANAIKSGGGYLELRHRRRPIPVRVVGMPFFLTEAPYDDAMLLLEDIKRFRMYIAGNHTNPRETERRLGQIGDVRRRLKKIADWMTAADLAITQMVKPLIAVHKAAGMDRLAISSDGTELLRCIYHDWSTEQSWESLIQLTGPGSRFPNIHAPPPSAILKQTRGSW
jgi:hypothetical protein